MPCATLRLQVKLEGIYRQKKSKYKQETKFCWGKISHLSRENNSLIYKAVIKIIKSYALVLWGCVRKSNLILMYITQNKIL